MDVGIEVVLQAARFAAARHDGQTRKGAKREPYVVHPLEVATLVARATHGADIEVIAAAILHDTVEDTGTSSAEIAAEFGGRIRDLVAEVTDDKSLAKNEQKRVQIETLSGRSTGAKLIRLADKTSNLRSLASDPPRNWSFDEAHRYIAFCRQIGDVARDVSPWLGSELDRAADQASARFRTAGRAP